MGSFFAAFGIDWHLLVIQGVNFAVLIGVLSYFLYRPLIKVIDDRRAKIAEGVHAAEAASQRLADAQEEGEGIIGAATREAEEITIAARAHANDMNAQAIKDAQSQADALLKDARDRAEESARRTLAQSQQEIAKAAILAAEKILREKSA